MKLSEEKTKAWMRSRRDGEYIVAGTQSTPMIRQAGENGWLRTIKVASFANFYVLTPAGLKALEEE